MTSSPAVTTDQTDWASCILSLGDIAFKGQNEDRPSSHVFAAVSPAFREADLVVGNLETPLLPPDRVGVPGKCTLRAAAAWAGILKDCGIGLVSLANNHIMDYGPEGLGMTLKAMDDAGVAYVGAGIDAASANAACSRVVKGRTFAFLARTMVPVSSPSYAGPTSPGTAFLDEAEMLHAVATCRDQADYVILLLHWGLEHYHYPSPQQRQLARRLIDSGVDVILGHHPHVLQGEEAIGSGLVVYSLGNFVFDAFSWQDVRADGTSIVRNLTLSPANRQGMMQCIIFNQSGSLRSEQVFSVVSADATVHVDPAVGRVKQYGRLCSRLHWPAYAVLWRLYALGREWQLRLGQQFGGLSFFLKLHKIRLRHIQEFIKMLKRSARISSGKSTNPYED